MKIPFLKQKRDVTWTDVVAKKQPPVKQKTKKF